MRFREFMCAISRCRLVVPLLLAVAVASEAPAVLPVVGPAPEGTPRLYIPTVFYDTTGRTGLHFQDYPFFPITGAKTQVFFEGHTVPDYTYPQAYFRYDVDAKYWGKPYVFRITVPTLGVFEGSSVLEAGYPSQFWPYGYFIPAYVIPTSPQELGLQLNLQFRPLTDPPPPNGQFVAVDIPLLVAHPQDSLSSPTYLTYFPAFPWAQNPFVRLTVEYLSLDTLPSVLNRQTGTITGLYFESTQVVLDPRAEWAGSPWSGYPSQIQFGKTTPPNPIRLSIRAEGYTTDSITLTLENMTMYKWYAYLRPLPPLDSAYYPEGVSFRQVSVSPFVRALRALDGKAQTTVDLDQNHDGAVDCADLVSFLAAIPSSN